MKDFMESNIFYKRCDNRTMTGKLIIIAVTVAMLSFSLSACGKQPVLGKSDQDTSITENTDGTVDTIPSADASISLDEDTSEDKDAPANGNTSVDDSWKVEFEKSLLENYGVKPDHYEKLENGVYQVYVEINGKIVPYVAVDSATGDYHG